MASYDVVSSIWQALIHGRDRGRAAGHAGRRAPGRAVLLDSIKTRVETSARLWFSVLKLQYDERLSNFAFSFNLRRYNPTTCDSAMQVADLLRWQGDTPSLPQAEVGPGRNF